MSSSVAMSRLAKVAQINPPLSVELPLDEPVSFVPMAAVSAETASVETSKARPYSEVSKGYTAFLSGDILFAKITPCFENGKIAQALLPLRHGFGSTEFHVIRPVADVSDGRYLHHYLRLDRVRSEGQRRMTGSGGQRRVPANYLAELVIPLPPLPEQRRIAAILDQAETLRTQRRAALAQLDSLTRSLFIDMFGDPVTNPKKWACLSVGETASKFSDGPFGSNLKSSHYTEAGVRVIRLQNIGIGDLIDKDKVFISDEHFTKLRKHECLPGDVLIGTLGEPNLRACIQPPSLSKALNKADCVQLRPNPEVANAAFLCALLNQPAVEEMAHDLMQGQTRVRISMGRLRGLVVPVPPLCLQQAFATRIQAIEALKKKHRAALTELDALFASLQERAFAGHL